MSNMSVAIFRFGELGSTASLVEGSPWNNSELEVIEEVKIGPKRARQNKRTEKQIYRKAGIGNWEEGDTR